jgi:hypothetical protein
MDSKNQIALHHRILTKLGGCKYEPGYKSHDLFLFGGKFIFKKPLQDLLSSLNAIISTNESTRITTSHVVSNPA